MLTDQYGQPIGAPLGRPLPDGPPDHSSMTGRWCEVVPLDASAHADELWREFSSAPDGRAWTYLPYGPFDDRAQFDEWVSTACRGSDPLFFALVDRAVGRPAGIASFLRIAPDAGSVEVGHIHFGPSLRRSAAATEAMYLMARRVFESGYRRYEWKCDALNAASRAAASRLGFTFEGVFRQATVYKGRNRDTAWFSLIDGEWPPIRSEFERWLAPANFDGDGAQRTRLRIGELVAAPDIADEH